MMMSPQRVLSIEQQIAGALRQLVALNGQSEQAKADVTQVLAELAQLNLAVQAAEHRLDATDAGRLLEANQHLVVSTLRAQTNADMYAESLEHMSRSAAHDALTALPNRKLFLDQLRKEVVLAGGTGARLAVLFIDLNNFKLINDTLGHGVGDEILQSAAHAMTSAVRGVDTVSRFGSDEFLILLTDIQHASDAALVAQKVISALGMPCRIGNHILRISASIGISIYPDDGDTPDLLIERANSAMLRVKQLGAGNPVPDAFTVDDVAIASPLPLASLNVPISHFDAAVADHERRADELRDANQGLVIAALNAQELQAAAERAQQQQREFLALVAHELRNPMAPLLVAASLLRGSDAMDLESMRKIIEEQVALMNRMVGDLLDLSRSSTGKLRLEFRPVELRKIIDEAIEAARPAMDIRLQHIDVLLPAQPIPMQGDPVRLAQILINLLDNAAKYTPEGGQIQLSASVDNDHVVIQVVDNGIGISADALARVFEPFSQNLHATAFNGQGLGLGLSVVKQLTEGHRGTVVVSSAGIGLGTRFTLTLPLEQNVAKTPALTRSN